MRFFYSKSFLASRLFTVGDTFLIAGRGIVAVPEIVPQSDERFRVGDPIRLKLPDGTEINWEIGGLELSCPLPPSKDVCVLLKGLGKENVPVGTEVRSVNKYPCPCCGYKTLDEKPPGTYDICPICLWEDDPVQFSDPDYENGRMSYHCGNRDAVSWKSAFPNSVSRKM